MTSDIEREAMRAFADGARQFDFGDTKEPGARRAALFAQTWAHILAAGEHRTGLKASAGLIVTETVTAQNGGIVWVRNASDTAPVSGYVPPFLPDVTLAPGEVFAYVHDAPIGEPVDGGRFLASYVGLVKSDAAVLAAHIRPAPFEGARIYVYGTPGDTREIVLFHGSERGRAVAVTFADVPRVYDSPPSQIVALSATHAGRTFFPDFSDNAPVLIGADDVTEHGEEYATVTMAPGVSLIFALSPDGAITEIVPPVPKADAPLAPVRIAL